MNFFKKQLLSETGLLPSQLNKEDYFELAEVMKAKSPDDRPTNGGELFKKLM